MAMGEVVLLTFSLYAVGVFFLCLREAGDKEELEEYDVGDVDDDETDDVISDVLRVRLRELVVLLYSPTSAWTTR